MGRSEFSGPPGTFTFTASGADCQGPNDYYFVASLWFMDTGGAFVGPFFSPPTTTRLLAPTAPLLRVFPGELTFNGLAGINPLAQTLQIRTVCGEVVSWTVADDAPWLSKDATSGTTPAQPLDPSRTRVAVDATGLDPGKVPFTATVAVSSPQAGNSPLAIPITLNLAP